MEQASQIDEEEVVQSEVAARGKPSREEDEGIEHAPQIDEEEVARWNNCLAAELGNGGSILVLFETYTGFAIFMYDGVKLLAKDAYQNIWVDFADHTVAKKTASLLEFLVFEDKANAIKPSGVDDKLATMIRKYIEPGQKLAVENPFYKDVIQNSMKISCMCGDTVNELMWGLKVQMLYLVPAEESKLHKEDRFPLSIGLKQLLTSYCFTLEPDLKVTRHMINLAGAVRECDRSVNRHDDSLRSAAEHLKRISGIDTQGWGLMKLLLLESVLLKLTEDAPKYEGKISKEAILTMYNEMYCTRCTRSKILQKLSRLLQQRKKVIEEIVQLIECDGSLRVECNKRQNSPTLAPADVLRRYTFISSHQLHSKNEPGILSMHIHPSKDVIATGGIDTNAVLFDRPSGQILCTFTGHSKKITTLKFVNGDELFITGSADETVRIWRWSEYGNYGCLHTLKDHTAEVAAVTVQANEKCFVSASKDKSWCLYDILTGSCQSKVISSEPQLDSYTSASFHPHGPLLGIGTATAVVEMWDMKAQSHIANLKGHVGPVTAVSFSENGYLLATAACNGVLLWDLRKLRYVKFISSYGSDTPFNAVEFDSSGSYLGIGSSYARVYDAEWGIIKTLPDLSGTGKVTSL